MTWMTDFPETLINKITTTEEMISAKKNEIQNIALANQDKVLQAFRDAHVSETHFAPSTGYGYDDIGRDVLETIYANVFHVDAAIVRPQIISGTHAISTALFGVLRPGDELLYITGTPYDTLLEIIGVEGNGIGSLKEYNIDYNCIPLLTNGKFDLETLGKTFSDNTKVVAIQRSRGYGHHASFTIEDIKDMIQFVRSLSKDVIVFVDNCYGEFAEELEPTDIGADLMAGSLIKNPGGGIAKTGGYIVGREDLIEQCAYRLTTPGIGKEAGAMLSSTFDMLQGFFLAPHTVSQAIQGAIFTSALLELHNIQSTPHWSDKRTDLIQMIELNSEEKMVAFCQAIQRYSPIDAYVSPVPAPMPGYEDLVVMAAGTFIQGASLELTSDGPLRPPYTLYVQGGLTYEHVKLAVTHAVHDVFY